MEKTIKIVLHNLTIPHETPSVGLYDFDQNGVHFSEHNDVIITRKKVPDAYVDFLNSCGYKLNNVTFINSENVVPNVYNAIFEDISIIKKIGLTLKNIEKNATLDSFALTNDEAHWAKKNNVEISGDPLNYYRFYTKSSFRVLAKKNRVNIPSGYEHQTNPIDAAVSAASLFLRGADEIVAKFDEGSTGLGSQRFTKKEFFLNMTTFLDFIKKPKGIQSSNRPSFIVERWHTISKASSLQFYISPAKNIKLLSSHLQLFYSSNIMRYKGCLSQNYLSEYERTQLEDKGLQLARGYANEGYTGHLCFNAIVLNEGTILFVETNPRRAMSSYPYQIKQVLLGDDPHVYYRSCHIQKNSWKNKTIEYVISSLSSILFSKTKRVGVIPFDYGLLASLGQLSIVGFSDAKEEVDYFFDRIEKMM